MQRVHCQRLEHFYYKTLVQDLLILTYNHREAPQLPPLAPQASIHSIFSTPIDQLPTRPLEASSTTYINSLLPRPVRKPWNRPVKNIMYGKISIEKETNIAPLPFTPTHQGLPCLQKIKVKVYTEAAIATKQVLLAAIMSLTQVTGVKAYPLFAEHGDSSKKIREGMPVGCEVELTGSEMYAFLDKLIHTVLPRIREWEGLNPVRDDHESGLILDLHKSSMGYFPDIEPFFDMYPRLFDTQIIFKTTGKNGADDALLLSGLGLPIRKTPVIIADVDADAEKNTKDPYAIFKKVDRKEKIPIRGTPIRKKI